MKPGNEDVVDVALHWLDRFNVFCMHWFGASPSQLNLITEDKADLYRIIFSNGQRREEKEEKVLFSFSQVIIKCLPWETLQLLSAGGCRQAEQALLPLASCAIPASTSAPKLCRRSPSTCYCQLAEQNGSAVHLLGCVPAKIQSDYSPMLQPVPRAGCHHQLTGGTLSPRWTELLSTLQYVCSNVLGAQALLACLLNVALQIVHYNWHLAEIANSFPWCKKIVFVSYTVWLWTAWLLIVIEVNEKHLAKSVDNTTA